MLSLSYRDATRFSDDSLRITSDYMYVGCVGWVADHVEYLYVSHYPRRKNIQDAYIPCKHKRK